MADHSEVTRGIQRREGVKYPALVPNVRGMEMAIEANVKEISVFTATSETFSKKNANCTLAESMQRIEQVIQLAQRNQIPVRGYISCVFVCPYEGPIAPEKTVEVAKQLINLGCEQIYWATL